MSSIISNPSSPEQTITALVEAVNGLVASVASLLGFKPAIRAVSASYVATAADGTILYSGVMDGSKGITLPTIGLSPGKIITVKVTSTDTTAGPLNVNTSNAAEWAGNPQLYAIPTGIATGGTVTLVWDGTAWWITEYSQ